MSKLKTVVGYLCGQIIKAEGDIERLNKKVLELYVRLNQLNEKACGDCSHSTTESTQNLNDKIL